MKAAAERPVFVVTVEGIEPPEPARLTVLAFVTAEDAAAAETAAATEVSGLGWRDVAVVRSGEVTDRGALPADFETAYANAERFGVGLIIYDEP